MFKGLLLQILAIMLLCSCGKEGYDFGNEENVQVPSAGQGEVEFMLSTDYTIRTRVAGEDLDLNPDNFSFAILNASGYVVEEWPQFSQVKGQSIKLNQGAYMAKAWYGDSTATGFDAIFFVGQTNFKVEKLQTTKNVNITCRQGNAKVAVVWGENIKKNNTDFQASVKKEGGVDSLNFSKDETRAGYVPAGNLKLRVSTTGADGVEKVYEHAAAIPVEAQDFLTLRIDSKSGGTPDAPEGPDEGYIVISYNIDTTVTDKPQQITIPAFLVSKPAPTLSGTGFDENNGVEFWEGDITAPIKIMINAQAFISSCKVAISSPFVNVTLPDTVDIVSDEANAAKLNDVLGIVWDDQLQNKRFATIDLTEFARNLRVVGNGAAAESTTISVSVVDMRGKVSGEVVYALTVKRPSLSLNAVPDYDMWANKAYVELITDVEDKSLFKFESLLNNIPTEVKSALVSTTGNVSRFEISGLEPGTSYIFRANYNNGLYYTNTVAVLTEAAQQLANGDMESWSNEKWSSYGAGTIYHYYPGVSSSDKGWSTRNTQTMEGIHSNLASTSDEVVAYRWNSCTIPTGDAVSGNAAEIRTMAFCTVKVTGTNVGSGIFWATKDVESLVSKNNKVYAGYLYTGKDDVTSQNPVPDSKGIAHQSRPSSVTFSYKYAPFNGDKCRVYAKVFDSNGSEIARTDEFVSGEKVDSYKEVTFGFTYSSTKSKAASIMVFFQSGTNETYSYVQFVDGSYDANPWSMDTFVGSVLKVDNVVLNY